MYGIVFFPQAEGPYTSDRRSDKKDKKTYVDQAVQALTGEVPYTEISLEEIRKKGCKYEELIDINIVLDVILK